MWPERIAVLYEDPSGPEGLDQAFAAAVTANGCRAELVHRSATNLDEYDLLLGYGPSTWDGSLLPVAEQLKMMSPARRPFFYWWYIECIPHPRIPLSFSRAIAHARVGLDTRTLRHESMVLPVALRKGFRFKILGELLAFRSQGLLNGLAVTSASRAAYLQRHGLESIVVPIGYDPLLHGQDLGLERTIDVGFLGNIASRRRHRVLMSIRERLSAHNIELAIEGNLYGDARTEFLNRTRILLNLFRSPVDYHGLRFLFCAANAALMVSEPVRDDRPFIPGEHLVVTPLDRMVDMISHYLADEEERRAIANRAQELVLSDYRMETMIARILADARHKLRARSSPTLISAPPTSLPRAV